MPAINFHTSHRLFFPRLGVDGSRTMRLLFGIRLLREIATKLSLFFLPVYLFQLGERMHFWAQYDLSPFQSGVVLLCLYQILTRLSSFVLLFPAADFIRRYGYSAALMLAHLLYAVSLVSLRFSIQDPRWLILAAVADGVNVLLMWGSFNTLFSKQAHAAKMGKDLGIVQALLNCIWMVTPAISGLIIFFIGYEFLFTAGLIFVGAAIILAALVEIPHERDEISWRELVYWIRDKRFVTLSISIAGKTAYDLAIYVWPLYVFLLLGNTERVGLLYGLSFLLSIAASMFIGRRLDRDEQRRPFTVSGSLLSALWLIRARLLDFWSLALVDAFDKITGNFHWLFFDRLLLRRGKGRQAFSYFMYRELVISAAVIVFWGFFALMFVLWPIQWNGLFVIGAVGILFSLLIRNKEEE